MKWNVIPVPAMAAISALALAACIVEEEPTFLRTEYETVIDIIGFFGDASVLVERRVTQVDWYSGDMDEFARRKNVSSQAKLYDFVAGRYGDSMSVEPNSVLMVRGISLYCRSGGYVQEYRFPTREAASAATPTTRSVSVGSRTAGRSPSRDPERAGPPKLTAFRTSPGIRTEPRRARRRPPWRAR